MRTPLIAAVLMLGLFTAPALALAVANGESCYENEDCDSGYCGPGFTCQSSPSGGGSYAGNTGDSYASNPGIGLINPLQSGDSLESFLLNILDFVIRIGSIVVILMMVFVGYKFVVAGGNETKISEARKMLLWTVVGALILIGAKVIAEGIKATVEALTSGG